MNRLASFFLRAKHWQIFLVFLVLTVISQIALTNSMLWVTREDFGKGLLPFFGVTLLSALLFNGWFWATGSFLNSSIAPRRKPGLGLFRFALVYPILYLPLFMAFFPPQPAMFAVLFPLHLLAMFCGFYLLNFVSKSLVTAERGKSVSFRDYASPFFLLWFFPIGVWTVQPRINRLYAERDKGEELSGVIAK